MGKKVELFDKITDGLKDRVDIKRGYVMAKNKDVEMNVATHQLFPTPVIFTNMDRPFTKKEKDFLDSIKEKAEARKLEILKKVRETSDPIEIEKLSKMYLDLI